MSSRSTVSADEFVPGKKLLVHIAENGHSYEFECDGSTPVEAIQRSIESLCGVHFSDQLLLCQNISLDSQQTLSFYKLPQDDCEVFLFNKSRLHADSPRPSAETIDIPNALIPSSSSPSCSPHPLDEASDPALKALASYEHQFRYHFQYANAIYGSTRTKFEICKRLFREKKVQERALETAHGNLEHTFKKLHQRYTEFIKCFNQQHRSHAELLNNFENDVERLRSVKLLPILQNNSRKCLLDLLKENELRKWADNCFHSHKQFETKVSQFKLNFGELIRRVDNVFTDMNYNGTKDLELIMNDHQKILNDQKSIMQSLSKDVNTVKKLVDDCVICQSSGSLRPHDAISALGPMYELHEKNHLPKVQNCDHSIAKLLEKSITNKNAMNLTVHFCMQKLKSTQINIKDMMNELHAFQEVMGQKEKEFDNLKLVNGIIHAYRACLAEVVRRKSSSKLYMGLAGQLAERLAAERAAEIRRREGFCKMWSKYVPNDVISTMGLFDSPSQCDVNIVPFDINLIDIDITDIDRYAPSSQSLISTKLFRTSSEAANFATFEENIENTCEKDDFDRLIERGFLADISGTSLLEVENARLKSELASAITLICSFNAEMGYDALDESESNNLLKTMKDKTAEALRSKDEYAEHIQSMLNMKHAQCLTYEKRILELEQRLKDRYNAGQIAANKCSSETKIDGYRGEMDGDEEAPNACLSTVSMEASCTSASADPRLDENMIDLVSSSHKVVDAPMLETLLDYQQECGDTEERVGHGDKEEVGENEGEPDKKTAQLSLIADGSDAGIRVLETLHGGIATSLSLESKSSNNIVLDLQSSLAERCSQFDMVESKLKTALEEMRSLRTLLEESQMNCAHLENCLHEAREEARTNLCAAERRASEYNALRATALKMHSLLERFRNCVTGLDSAVNFAENLRSFALSLGSGPGDGEDDAAANFRACILVISDKATIFIRRVEHLSKQIEDQRELIKTLYRKHQLEKQASKEKVAFLKMEVHELAAFILNSSGNYEAMNRNCPNHFLSSESVTLFTEHSSRPPAYIIGQIVHIEKQTVRIASPSQDGNGDPICFEISASRVPKSPIKGSSNPYGLPVGCEYFIVTVAMLPDTTIHSSPS